MPSYSGKTLTERELQMKARFHLVSREESWKKNMFWFEIDYVSDINS